MASTTIKLRKQSGGTWHVISDEGRVLGKHATKKEALAQAVAVKISYEDKGKKVEIKTTSVRESRALVEADGADDEDVELFRNAVSRLIPTAQTTLQDAVAAVKNDAVEELYELATLLQSDLEDVEEDADELGDRAAEVVGSGAGDVRQFISARISPIARAVETLGDTLSKHVSALEQEVDELLAKLDEVKSAVRK